MVVISLLEFVYALKVEISSIQVEFEVYVKESVKQGKVDFELYDEDLERYNKLKSGKILK